MSTDSSTHNLKLTPSWPIILSGAGVGALLAWDALSGDAQGRVNLFYLLFVYLFIPLVSLIVSSLSLVRGKGINLARLVSQLPIWSNQVNQFQRKLSQLNVDKFWFYFQSHLAALAYAMSSVLIFFVLLLASDVNFVWRSTLLSGEEILPLLELVALPWFFWEQAQPTINLIEYTQDSRMQISSLNGDFGAWWRFVLAVQIFYGVILRGVLLLLTSMWFKWKLANDVESQLSRELKRNQRQSKTDIELAEVIHHLPSKSMMVTNWGGIDLAKLAGLESSEELSISSDNLMNAGPLASDSEQRVAERWRGPQLVLVKAWEPPLAELKDYLQNSEGIIFPVDWTATDLQPIRQPHMQEWQRFVAQLPEWKVFVPLSLMPQETK